MHWATCPYIVILSLFLLFSFTAFASETTSVDGITLTPEKVIGFADNLYENKEYYRAITEYMRFNYLFPDDPRAMSVKYKIGLSYFKGEKYEEAAERFKSISILSEKNEVTKKAHFKLAETYYSDSDYLQSAQTYEEFIATYPDAQEAFNAQYQIGWSYLHSKSYDEAKRSFQAVLKENPYYSVAQNISVELDSYSELPQKSPQIAGALSAIIPGAGQAYCGRYKDAVASFILNGIFIWGTVELYQNDNDAAGGVLAFFSLMWYSGNIYSAMSSAYKFNRDVESDFINNIDSKYNLSLKYDPETKSEFLVFNLQW